MEAFALLFLLLFFVFALTVSLASENERLKFDKKFWKQANIGEVQKLLKDVNHLVDNRDEDNLTVLMYAVRYNLKPEVISYLIDEGADVNAEDNDGKTVLMYIVETLESPWGDSLTEIISYLIDEGADVNAEDNDGKTVLMYGDEARETSGIAEILQNAGATRAGIKIDIAGKDTKFIEIVDTQKKYNANGKLSGYEVELEHTGLDEYEEISAPNEDSLQQKLKHVSSIWQAKWHTQIALDEIQSVKNILQQSLTNNQKISLKKFKQDKNFEDKLKKGDTNTVDKYCKMVLDNSEYLESFPKRFNLQYNEKIRFF
ncbi:MAG: ankyrin repeat domain-containing protein [Alphaproteobacteria bacterium]|nr:ankyrin repeat domain-containing protein [Alphaproteobacteria bacterium]